MTRNLILALALLLGLAPGVPAQPGGSGVDCFAEWFADARFVSRSMGDGQFLYQVELVNHRPQAVRYTYRFTLPVGDRPAEGLNGYLTAGGSIEHALGSGQRNLSAQALRSATTMRCFPL